MWRTSSSSSGARRLAHHVGHHARSSEEGPEQERGDHHERNDHDDDVGAAIDAAPERVEPHRSTVPADDGRPRGAGRWRGDDHAQSARQEERARRWTCGPSSRGLFDDIATSQDDRVVVITGAGDAFCSGADLSGAADGPTGNGLFLMRQTARVALRLHELPQPTIAAVNGVAAGYGCNLALGCDLVLASDAARFSEIFLKRGLAIDGGGSWLLPRLIGLHKAKELAFFADIISARTTRSARHREQGRARERAHRVARGLGPPTRRTAADADLDREAPAQPLVLDDDGRGTRVGGRGRRPRSGRRRTHARR